jgi:hypothetical protein
MQHHSNIKRFNMNCILAEFSVFYIVSYNDVTKDVWCLFVQLSSLNNRVSMVSGVRCQDCEADVENYQILQSVIYLLTPEH